ncbi:MAG TPA: GAF domain-containing protein [Candidatus Limnocylindrales bacterium]|nr:GAF domain-containing protein [Candidatus Limnocylindrales bacterium]
MESVDVGTGPGHVADAAEAAGRKLAPLKTVPAVAESALGLALDLTGSTVAFLAVFEPDGEGRRVFSAARQPFENMTEAEIDRVFAASGVAGPVANAMWAAPLGAAASAIRSTCTQPLEAGGESFGMLCVASPAGYTLTQQRAFTLLAQQASMAMALARMHERRQEMVDTLVNLRADLDRSERRRLVNEERARSAERVERAHEASVDALLAVSRHARAPHGLADFYRLLTRSIAELVAARKVLFWQRNKAGMLVAIPGADGIDEDFLAGLKPVPCAPDRDDLASRIVFHDLMFRASRTDVAGDFLYVLDTLKVADAIAVPWRAGDQRLGLVAAYESLRPEGFSREDTWVLQKAGLAAGLVWQLKYAEVDLKKTAERLQKVDAARQVLLKNVSTAVEKARRRFAGDLHDDALQKLTAVELQLQRLREPNGDAGELLTQAQEMLGKTEDALRRLLFEVRPPTLEVAGGFVETIRERVQMLRSLTGAEVEVEIDLPEDMAFEDRSTLYRQLTEAMTNIEKHASATRVVVSLKQEDNGVHGRVQDNGRGFVVAERTRVPGHLGLLALNERALLAGGWNKTESEPGLGTVIEFWIPLYEAAAQK